MPIFLFYFFNPILTSLRGIQQVSHLEKVKKMLGVKGTSLGSLSEASNVFDADLIAPLIKELAKKAKKTLNLKAFTGICNCGWHSPWKLCPRCYGHYGSIKSYKVIK